MDAPENEYFIVHPHNADSNVARKIEKSFFRISYCFSFGLSALRSRRSGTLGLFLDGDAVFLDFPVDGSFGNPQFGSGFPPVAVVFCQGFLYQDFLAFLEA